MSRNIVDIEYLRQNKLDKDWKLLDVRPRDLSEPKISDEFIRIPIDELSSRALDEIPISANVVLYADTEAHASEAEGIQLSLRYRSVYTMANSSPNALQGAK